MPVSLIKEIFFYYVIWDYRSVSKLIAIIDPLKSGHSTWAKSYVRNSFEHRVPCCLFKSKDEVNTRSCFFRKLQYVFFSLMCLYVFCINENTCQLNIYRQVHKMLSVKSGSKFEDNNMNEVNQNISLQTQYYKDMLIIKIYIKKENIARLPSFKHSENK